MWKCCPCFAKTYEVPEVLELDFRHSSLSEVPADVFTFERTLEKLDLGSNQISDLPPSLFHCHELKELDLCDNDLMSIPPAVGSLTRLCKLDLSRNAITDVADSIKNCKNLIYFDLSMNHLTKLPEGISQLVNLEELFLNDTYLEFLHANFGRLTKLKVLELRENAIQTLPKSMSRLHHLQRLDVGQNDLIDLPEVVGTMTNLTELWTDNNRLKVLPPFIGNLTKLNCLDASQNEIQGIAEEISKCTLLSDVTLNINSLEVLPDSFTKLENISVLRLDCNSLSHLPEEFGNLKNLAELSIVGNSLKSLPTSIGLLRKLHTLYLDDNLLTSVPKEIGSCTSLTVLSLAKNRLKEIPSEVGHLSSLKVFTLSGNLIIHLPVSILNITKLGALWLSESQSKPLLQLNKEIDPTSGQHVLTCFLLPQLPSTGDEASKYMEESKELPRRSKPSIKFLSDVEPVVVAEPNVNKRGLLRAPTPYPKELRALAKHASQIRQSKELNGDVMNTDEPEYEGDYPEELSHQPNGSSEFRNSVASSRLHNSVQKTIELVHNASSSNKNGGVTGETILPLTTNSGYSSYHSSNLLSSTSTSKVDYKSPLPLPKTSGMDTIGLPGVSPYSSSSTSTSSNTNYPGASSSASYLHKSTVSGNTIQDNAESGKHIASGVGQSQHETRFTGLPDGPDKSSRENYGASATEMARKSPPPYHVAARRAAFFRSSGGAGSGRIGSPTPDSQIQPVGHTRASPIIGRMFPLPLPSDANVYSSSIPSSSLPSSALSSPGPNQTDIQGNHSKSSSLAAEIDDEECLDGVDSASKNFNYTISKNVEDSDVVSSMEENLDGGPPLDLDSRSLNSKNLVKTIESALESVDKRTTEFLREDHWEDQEDHIPAKFPPPPSDDVLYSNMEDGVDQINHTNVEVTPRPTTNSSSSSIPSGIPGYSSMMNNRGPAVPPKPSPLPSRHHQTGLNLNSPGSSTTMEVNRSDSHSKIPTLPLLYSSKFSSNQMSSSSSVVNNSFNDKPSPQLSSEVDHSNIVVGLNSDNVEKTSNLSSLRDNSNSILGGGQSLSSRIPKLPTLTSPFHISTSQVIRENMPITKSSQQQPQTQFQHKKPEILSPKPSIVRNVTTPSRIPSFGAGDGKFKDEPAQQFLTPNKSSFLPPPSPNFSSFGKTNPSGSFIVNSSSIPVLAEAEPNASINLNNSITGTKIPRMDGEPTPEKSHELKRTGSGTRIPKFNDNSRTASPSPASHLHANSTLDNSGYIPENNNEADTSLSTSIPGVSRIPSLGKKPWIFGTHKNARVVAVEFKKINSLGFSISEAPAAGNGQGIFIIATDTLDSTVKVGDKILQVDGIDVSNMGVEIVKKILSNCQENINLLVSRKN